MSETSSSSINSGSNGNNLDIALPPNRDNPFNARYLNQLVHKDHIIPHSWKIGLALYGFVASIFILFTVLALTNILPLSGWKFYIVAGGATFCGLSVTICSVWFVFRYFNIKNQRLEYYRREHFREENRREPEKINGETFSCESEEGEEGRRRISSHRTHHSSEMEEESEPEMRGSDSSDSEEDNLGLGVLRDDEQPPLSYIQWAHYLKTAPQTNSGCYYNLEDPSKPIAKATRFGFLQLPVLGRYSRRQPQFQNDSSLMAARLPREQIKAFPRKLQSWLKKEDEIECLFVVFDNTQQYDSFKRNIAFHAMALPEYDPQHPTTHKGTSGVRTTEEGLETDIRMAMFDPQGVKQSPFPNSAKESRIPVDADSGDISISIHPTDDRGTAFSNNVGQIVVDGADVSSVYLAAKFRGKAVAVHAVILNNDNSLNGRALRNAVGQDSVYGFIKSLKNSNFKYFQQVKRTFTYNRNF